MSCVAASISLLQIVTISQRQKSELRSPAKKRAHIAMAADGARSGSTKPIQIPLLSIVNNMQ